MNFMKYQVSYLSPTGSCVKLVEAFENILEDVCVVDLTCDNEIDGEIHLVGFELNEINFKAIPYEIMAQLDQLEDKTILLFATCPFCADQTMKAKLERIILPFLPENCDYRGLFLCTGQASDSLLANVRALAARRPEDEQAGKLLKSCEDSAGHPNEADIMQACLFVTRELELE